MVLGRAAYEYGVCVFHVFGHCVGDLLDEDLDAGIDVAPSAIASAISFVSPIWLAYIIAIFGGTVMLK
jgi:hypothetical protein